LRRRVRRATVAAATTTQLHTDAVPWERAIDCKAVGLDKALAAARPQDMDIDFDTTAGSYP
jgi:NADPH-dependent curcumin reductase CurA